ncbi:MAG: galactokinase [Microbacteriaceae bacterium]
MTDQLARSAADLFESKFGYQPTGVWSAPGRVNLIGEHTDYNEGFVLPFAINRRTYAAVAARTDNRVRVATSFASDVIEIEMDSISVDSVDGWSSYPLGVVWAIHEKTGAWGHGLDIFIDSDVPVGAGLSSSAAIECAVAVAVNELWDTKLQKRELARIGQRAENVIVGAPTGIMDQSASMLGELDHAVFLDCRDLSAQSVELGFAEAGLEILIIDTKVEHRHADGGYASRRASCELGAQTMGVHSLRDLSEGDLDRAAELLDELTFRRVRHIVTENQRVLDTVATLKSDGPRAIGDLLYGSHESMRDDFEISIDELDTAVETALRHGAVGARMTGGGFGGAAIALTPVELISEVTLAVRAEFEALGYGEPHIFAVSAAPGATRVF